MPRLTLLFSLLLILSLVAQPQSEGSTPDGYTVAVIQLDSYALAMNDAGQVVGYQTDRRAWVWEAGDLELLPIGRKDTYSAAYSINDAGVIAGEAGRMIGGVSHSRPVLWQGGRLRKLPLISGTKIGGVNYISDRGDVVGWCSRGNALRATVWFNRKPRALRALPGTTRSEANGINQSRQIVGTVSTIASDGRSIPCLWQDGQLIQLPFPSGSSHAVPLAINDAGRIVGYASLSGNSTVACVWENGTVIPLGTLGGHSSTAVSINDAGWVVGSAVTADSDQSAFLWKGTGPLIDLRQQAPGEYAPYLREGRHILDNGLIVVNGESAASNNTCFLLTPKG